LPFLAKVPPVTFLKALARPSAASNSALARPGKGMHMPQGVRFEVMNSRFFAIAVGRAIVKRTWSRRRLV